ncbi:STM4015 family protein [Paenibacillus sp. JX-17]|uniref:STM4015 family protein n=1 Tax=Paenibacillus lacisoli TaxID=3064525 RepID=A0ABT9C736_9BACL|nr:STM4015 family protein [Paenibacillus sp. JX-17]MDO7905055.1 STM4015 family protein [Paenibacillus sp. JX-17]
MTEVKLKVDYDEYENGVRITKLIEDLSSQPDSAQLTSLIIGDWGQAYENSSEDVVRSLVEHHDRFPSLRKLFIGDMGFEECEVSWIVQTDLSPLLAAYPQLESFRIKGSNGLALTNLKHENLKELVIICGGLGSDVLQQIAEASLPQLEHLELYLGVDEYGFDGGLENLLPLIEPGKFPKLTFLGLKNSEIQDEIAEALADAPILDQLETLDLSDGTLSDQGAEALIQSDRIKRLKHLDLHHHYMSDDMVKRWTETGISVDVSEQEKADDENDWRYPSITE